MSEQSNSNSLSDLQATVLELIEQNPEMTNSEIAAETGTHVPLVRDLRSKYEASEANPPETNTGTSETGDDTNTRERIRELIEDDPDLTNADIADEVGAHVALVRDIRNEHTAPSSETSISENDEPETTATSTSDSGDTRAQILDLIENDPDLTNAEIAEQVGTHVALVRDTRSEHTEQDEARSTTDDSADDSAAGSAETDESVDTRARILDLIENEPDLTNAEIADEVGAHVALVRDIRSEHGSETEATETGGSTSTDTSDETSDPESTDDTEESVDTRSEVVRLIEQNPDRTNAEIADAVGTHVALVRDIRSEHAETDDQQSAQTVERDSAEPSTDATRADVVELIEQNPEMTNAEIAAETGKHVALVRDIRREHGASGAAASDSEPEGATDTDGDGSDGRTDTRAAVVALIEDDAELTNAEIAEEVGAHVALVRDIRSEHAAGEGKQGDMSDQKEADDESGQTAEEPAVPEIDTDGLSDTQVEILELASKRPQLTNAEIAEEVGTHVAVVRDLRNEHKGASTSESETADPSSEGSATEPETTSEDSEAESDAGESKPVADEESSSQDSATDTSPDVSDDSSATTATEAGVEDTVDDQETEVTADTPQGGLSDIQIVLVVFGVLLAIGFIALL